MGMIYRWKPGSSDTVDADVAGAILERVRTTNNGRLTQAMVVDEATPRSSPLHGHFEWNDGKAARLYRLDQAAHLIRSIEVIHTASKQEAPIRAFVSVVRDEDRSYTSVAHALTDPELRQQVLSQAWRELEAWRKRHAELTEFAKLFAAIDQARAA